ncbi:uncharacterized protein [Struthio camelus]|uniref:uncharacterized protein isoform X5 n=1 Tax=Struthio camelus TaxID=8801 RepID=UPI00051E62DD|nr:PREDICTED: uncharacterized protein LOC104144410 isoform X6 [Struthio camelus australis]
MASAWQKTQEYYSWVLESGDPRTDPWPLVYSPLPVTLLFAFYLFVVALGPCLMRKREPLKLKGLLITYNLAMVTLSSYMFYEFLVTSVLDNYSYLCQPVDYSRSELGMRVQFCTKLALGPALPLADGKSVLVVLLFQSPRAAGYGFLYSAQETRTSDFPACISPRHDAVQLVVRRQICSWGTSLLYWDVELLCTYLHVHVLCPGKPGTTDAALPVVEALSNHHAAGIQEVLRYRV